MKKHVSIAVVALISVFMVACSGQEPTEDSKRFAEPSTTKEKPAFVPWIIEDSSKIIRTESGLGIYIVEEGPGEKPGAGQTVQVNYHGMLTNGSVFDSSFERGSPFSFPLGMGRVIGGWDEGIALLNYGTKAILIIPSNLGYGERGSPPNIPPNSTLIFHVQLLGTF